MAGRTGADAEERAQVEAVWNDLSAEGLIADRPEIAGRLRDGFGYEKMLEEILVERQFGAHNNSHKKEAMTRELMQILRARVASKSQQETTRSKLTYIIVPVFNGELFLD